MMKLKPLYYIQYPGRTEGLFWDTWDFFQSCGGRQPNTTHVSTTEHHHIRKCNVFWITVVYNIVCSVQEKSLTFTQDLKYTGTNIPDGGSCQSHFLRSLFNIQQPNKPKFCIHISNSFCLQCISNSVQTQQLQ
jgi:hypothetical protein